MTAPGAHSPPPQRSPGGGLRITTRQLVLSLVPVLSVGFLAFVPFLYLALTRRRRADWLVCAVYVAVVAVMVVLVSTGQRDSPATALAGGLVLVLMGGGALHSFVALRPGTAPAAQAIPRAGQPDQSAVLHAAKARVHLRARARKLAAENPALARDLKIGRPDLPRDYDDGGLVDINHVPADILVRYLGLSAAEADAVVAARLQLGGFSSRAEVTTYANLPSDRLDGISDLIIFG